jgi:FAD/FMN-containing dehydrogenase
MSTKYPREDPTELSTEPLIAGVAGPVITRDDPGYDEARAVWNGMVDRAPLAIVQCAGPTDVVEAIRFAAENDLPLAVRSGGHNVAGKSVCDDGVVVDLSAMNDVTVDPTARTARVGPGATWGEFDAVAQEYGLATTGGIVSTTGVGGLTLGGGIGYLARTHGLAMDNLRSVELVTAAGDVVRASEDEHPDLFWGIRGGGGNLGVVTAMEFDLHEVGPEVYAAQAFYPFSQAQAVLEFYREFTADAPAEVSCYAFVAHVPPEEPFPEATHGDTTIALVAAYSGDTDDGDAFLAPIEAFGDPIFRVVGPMPYTALQQSFDAGAPKGTRAYWKATYVDEIPDDVVDVVLDRVESLPGPLTLVAFEPMGGAIAHVGADETAYPHREATYNFGIFAGWLDEAEDDAIVAWTREFHEAMAPYSTGGVYANYLDGDDTDRVANAYGENYDRLAALKAEWDPENRFRLNQNVEPAA